MNCSHMVWKQRVGGNSDVINVDTDSHPQGFVFQYDVAKDVVHHGLEGGRRVCQTKEHHCQFEKSITCLEGALFLVAILNTYVVIPTVDVHFHIILGSSQVMNVICCTWDGHHVAHHHSVDLPVVLDQV